MKEFRTIVLSRSGAVLAVFPGSNDGRSIERHTDLETSFPGVCSQIDRLNAGKPSGTVAETVQLPAGESVQLILVEAVSIQRHDCDISCLVKDALAPIERQAQERDVSIRFERADSTPLRAEVDPVKVAWVISALVGNALRFVKSGSRHLPGGTITVRAELKPDSDSLGFTIEDDGPGIPQPVVADLLRLPAGTPPYRGVALRLARDIVHAHGGSFQILSPPDGADHGTVIQFDLPGIRR